ncbi:MAG: iron-containing alcohol dehydrogenase [Anaerolineales bacterium]|nr:iron-containing alcohol dehydrogenase [Anaerolineales bacterium]MCB8951247.1 iron-containing alcohol dehydrogenase [Ardenticatenales bacterium]
MWFFRSPHVYFGEDALSHLAEVQGRRAFIVTDEVLLGLGFPQRVQAYLEDAGISSTIFAAVEPQPSLQTVQRGAAAMLDYAPDWVIGLGGGSCMDAARAMWILYERPDIDPAAISPMELLGLRQKARLMCIPTTAGTGSETGYAVVLTDTVEQRKLTLGSPEATADLALVDPAFTLHLPRQATADTGIDVLTHAIEGYTCQWANDFTDGPCLKAIDLVFRYLPRAVAQGAADAEAREKMANAAAIAGLALGNSNVALAHALGHSAGALFHDLPHGRITALFLPYTIEFVAPVGTARYQEIAHMLRLPAAGEAEGAASLAEAVRRLMQEVGLPLCLRDAGISPDQFAANLQPMCERADTDTNILMSRRLPETEEVQRLFEYAYDGRSIDF